VKRGEIHKVAGEETIICVGCPLGCRIRLTISETNEVVKVDDHKCEEGKQYALEEVANPVRTLTATVLTQDSAQPLLPVRTAKPILKTLLKQGMAIMAETRVKPPVRIGDVVVADLFHTGVDVVASSDLLS
jgi:CxxC motif-containing protein